MDEEVKEYKLQGRFLVHKPARNGSKIEAINEGAEFVTDSDKEAKAKAIKANNAKAAAAARKKKR